MKTIDKSRIRVEKVSLRSEFLQRDVEVDFYFSLQLEQDVAFKLILLNDGQLMEGVGLIPILESLLSKNEIGPVVCVAIPAGNERKMEYGIAARADYLGRGGQASLYTAFIMMELMPFIYKKYDAIHIRENIMAGFSLGGLMALDIVWNYPEVFSKSGAFSGSFWWRSLDQKDKNYDDDKHRIMHQQIRNGRHKPGLQFFFQCGNQDETRDRNKNGIIDSIDDTLDLVKELENKGYQIQKDIHYLELQDGRHDVDTWAKALPEFLKWVWR